MSDQLLSTRRDVRYALRPGAAFLSIPTDGLDEPSTVAPVTLISLSGVAFRLDAFRMDLGPGGLIKDAVIRVGACEIAGNLAIREVHHTTGSEVEVGALFYPSDIEDENRHMALIAGIEAVRED